MFADVKTAPLTPLWGASGAGDRRGRVLAQRGLRRALLPVRRQVASPERSAPVPPLDRVQGRVSASHRQIQSSRVHLSAAA